MIRDEPLLLRVTWAGTEPQVYGSSLGRSGVYTILSDRSSRRQAGYSL
nr:MAG TPA: hypothetical protein [Caudoviricetes sp.]